MSMSDTTWSPIVDCLRSRYIWCLVFFNNWIKNQWGLFLSDGHTRVKLIEHFCPIPVTPLLSRWSSYCQAHMTTPSIDWVFKSLWPPFHSPSFTTRPTNAQQMKKADINSFILGVANSFSAHCPLPFLASYLKNWKPMKPLNDEVCTTTTALHCVCMWYQKWRKTRSVFYNWWLIFSQFYVHPLHFMIDDRKFEKCCIWAAQPSALILDTWSWSRSPPPADTACNPDTCHPDVPDSLLT